MGSLVDLSSSGIKKTKNITHNHILQQNITPPKKTKQKNQATKTVFTRAKNEQVDLEMWSQNETPKRVCL